MDAIRSELAPHGVLRAGINLSNSLLVTGRAPSGDPVGVAPDMAREIAARLGVPVVYVPYANPGEIADSAGADAWDIGLIGAEPARARIIAFTTAYAEIEASYLVPPGSPLHALEEVDQPGIRVAVTARTAYCLWLERNIKRATLVQSASLDTAYEQFLGDKLDALAGLGPRLISESARLPGSRILAGRFTVVQQAIGTSSVNAKGAAFLQGFVEDARNSGLVAQLIARHRVVGLSVASS
jgi:polar amino acid transport system substrate-binding protein